MGCRSHREGADGNAGSISAGLRHAGSQRAETWHSQAVKALSDEQIEQAIEAIQNMLAAQAGEATKVIEGTAEPAALLAPNGPSPEAAPEATLEPTKRKPNRLMMEADTAVGPKERKPRKRVPSPAGT